MILSFRELQASKKSNKYSKGFVMHVSDSELEATDSGGEEEDEDSAMVAGTRFSCDEFYMRFALCTNDDMVIKESNKGNKYDI